MVPLTALATRSPSRNVCLSPPVEFVSPGSTTVTQDPSASRRTQDLSGFGDHSRTDGVLPATVCPFHCS